MDNGFNQQQPGQNNWQQQGQWSQQPQQNQWQQQAQQQQYQQQQYQQQQNWQNPQPQYQDPQGQWQPNPNYPDPNLGSVGFVEAIKICFTKYADFKGRAPRAEFWWFYLFTVIVNYTVGLIPFVGTLLQLALVIPSLAVSWRRMHDIGKCGAWSLLGGLGAVLCGVGLGLIGFGAVLGLKDMDYGNMMIVGIPFIIIGVVALILPIVWFATAGEPRPNRFGPNPYGLNDGMANC